MLAPFTKILPGLMLCLAVTLAAVALAAGERSLFGDAYIEALVLAILVGTAVRTSWLPSPLFQPGIHFSAKLLLEIAVVLLGASVTLRAVAAAGPWLLVGIAAVVAAALATSFTISRLLGLPTRMAALVACGNSICGNSAIAAVAPVIGATSEEVSSSIAFTAILGVIVVLGLPLLVPVLTLSNYAYGVLAGMTVYAVPQVLAATAPVGALSTQVGTLVKLVRVLMLGPVVLGASLAMAGRAGTTQPGHSLRISRLVPWFIIGFLALAALRSAGALPAPVLSPVSDAAGLFTLIAMAALGLGTDLKVIRRVGSRAVAAVSLSLVLLIGLSVGLLQALRIS